ncbi:MAG: sugar phosphate isomerase/epimerase [Candidatus Latescibacteria bacterium]|nr:sugar phosphate isomerase/epimerase [Candidatus Latescibacterota bacterium]
MKFATCNEYFEHWPIEEVFAYAAEVGYQGVEIAPFTLAPSVEEISTARRGEIRRAAEAAGVEIVGLHWLLVSPTGLYINHPDEGIRKKTRDYFEALIRCCGDLGGQVMIIGSPKQRNVQEGWDFQQAWERTRVVFESCLKTAEGCGVYLCFEPLSPDQTNFITTVAQARQLVAQIGHPHFQTMVDVCSGSSEAVPVPQLLRDAGPHLYHVHVNDANKRGPGFGQSDFVGVLQTLQELKYERYVSVEVFDFKPDPRTIAAASLAYLRGIQAALG